MNKHTPEITDEERSQILGKARELAKEFDAIGRECDVAGRFPTEMVPLYRASGIAAMAAPKKFGGLGADIYTTSQVGMELSKGDPAIALSFNMHQSMVGIFRNSPALDESVRASIMTAVGREGKILCGPFSEARAGLAGLADTVAVPDPAGGWRITGKKNWSTLIEGADLIALNATITDVDGRLPEDYKQHAAQEATFVIPRDMAGVSIDKTWNTMGMRATGSHTLVLDGALATPQMYGGNFRQGLIGESEWAAILFGGVYLGLAEKAYVEAREILKMKHSGATMAAQDQAAAKIGYVPYVLGRMRTELDVAARALESTGRMAIDGTDSDWPTPLRKARWDVAKVVTTEAAVSITDQALRLVGGQAFRRGHLIERLFRDARAGLLHSFGTDQLYDFYGRYELGVIGA